MKLTDPIEFMVLGGRIRYFAGRNVGDPIFGENFILENLQYFREDLEALGFRVSCNLFDRTINSIVQEYEGLSAAYEEDEKIGKLTEAQANNLVSSMLQFENTVFSEAKTTIIASPVPRRFDLEHLLQSPGKILGKDVFDSLTDLAQSDISYSCKCLAFECPTAAAFHMLRAIEECIRVLFKCYFPRGDEKRPWGSLTEELKNKPKKPRPDDILIGHLDHIRIRFRNPTDHPEKIYEIEEAEDLVHLAVDIINRCIRDNKVATARRNQLIKDRANAQPIIQGVR